MTTAILLALPLRYATAAMVLKWMITHLTDRGPSATFSGEQGKGKYSQRLIKHRTFADFKYKQTGQLSWLEIFFKRQNG
ncbi:hypothetical protein [Pseudoalteromonas aurantia]|nr:hypothetical protein [Pseudoalteromonas aurantia]